jgi:hypothetical protein
MWMTNQNIVLAGLVDRRLFLELCADERPESYSGLW